MVTTDKGIRCPGCNKKIAEKLVGELWTRCVRCKRSIHIRFDRNGYKVLD
jgi:DNA-directed RNA polymerase subunit RPC12/RpoP